MSLQQNNGEVEEGEAKQRKVEVITFVRDPLSRFYSQYDEAYVRTAPWQQQQQQRDGNNSFSHPYPYLYENIHSYQEYEDVFVPFITTNKFVRNTLKPNIIIIFFVNKQQTRFIKTNNITALVLFIDKYPKTVVTAKNNTIYNIYLFVNKLDAFFEILIYIYIYNYVKKIDLIYLLKINK
jgi:hypothetical protein